jgi:type IV fimbrial biogenesis protein FimT
MITIAMMSILAGIAFPSFTSTIRNNRVTTATNDLLAAINLARGEAITRARPVTVCASLADASDCSEDASDWATNGWLVVCSNAAGDKESCVDDDAGVLRVFNEVPPVVIKTTGTLVRFDRQGAASPAAEFEIQAVKCTNKQRRQIQITAMGRARSVEMSCST